MARTGVVLDPRYLEHKPPGPHPENPDRLEAVHARLRSAGILDRSVMVPARAATREEILLNHEAQLLERIEKTSAREATQIDPDTLWLVSSDNSLYAPQVVTSPMTEAQEGEFLQFNN